MEEITKELVTVENGILEVQTAISVEVAKFEAKLTGLQEQQRELRAAIKDAMEQQGVKKFENEFVSLTYVAPSERKTLDVTKLKEKEPATYEAYLKVTEVPSQLRVKVHEVKQ